MGAPESGRTRFVLAHTNLIEIKKSRTPRLSHRFDFLEIGITNDTRLAIIISRMAVHAGLRINFIHQHLAWIGLPARHSRRLWRGLGDHDVWRYD